MKPRLIVVLGPTASGKSAAALDLAARFDGEIISADSQQVYRYMDIGTAKPSPQQRAQVPHHLIDVVDPDEAFSAADFRRLGLESIGAIGGRGKNIVVCGGTGLYIKALIEGLFVGPGRDPEIRRELERQAREQGLGALYRRLQRCDSAAAGRIHPHDRQRTIRALEVYLLTGRKLSEWQSEHNFADRSMDVLKIGLDRSRADLYARIDSRCDQMIQSGLVNEVRKLMEMGYALNLKPLQSVGYRHAGWSIEGRMALDDAVAMMKRDTRRLAKRQLTWFRRDPEIRWFEPDHEGFELTDAVRGFLQ